MCMIKNEYVPFCKHVVATTQLKRDSVGHGAVTINNARIIDSVIPAMLKSPLDSILLFIVKDCGTKSNL